MDLGVGDQRTVRRGMSRRRFVQSATLTTAAAAALSGKLGRAASNSLAKPEKRPLNLIFIMTDTWRADHLGCYGNKVVKTPRLDQLARESVVFTNVYADGLPTIPCRRVLYTGKSILPFKKYGDWRPLFDDDVTFAETVRSQGFTSGLIADCPHFFAPGMNLHRGFDSWEWIRGQEFDRWRCGPKEKFDTRDYLPRNLWEQGQNRTVLQYLLNTQDMHDEQDYFCARSCRAAMDWLERNQHSQPFTLWIEMFDPHEPWDAPKRFQTLYYDRYPCERFLFGYGVDPKKLTAADIEALRWLYAAEITFTDEWIGKLYDKIAQLGLLDNTLVVFSTDHGTHLGEQGCVQKTPGLLNSLVAQVPLIVRHPDTTRYAGKRVDALVSVMDYMPTLLALLGAEPHSKMDGQNFWTLVDGEKDSIHEELFVGFSSFAAIRTLEWHYFESLKAFDGQGEEPEEYGFHGLAQTQRRGPCLYDLKKDRAETMNVAAQHPEVVRDLRRRIAERFEVSA